MMFRTLMLVSALVCGLVAAGASAHPTSQTAPGDALDPRTYDADSRLFLITNATGVQKYTCQPNGTWLFTDPEAALYEPGTRKPKGAHFLNFGTGRPVWQWQDGSSVEAARRVTGAAVPGNIAPLLLEAVGTMSGPDGDRLARTTWVQRLNTSGGVAPAGSCLPGATAAVPYTTDYYFWKS